MAPVGIEVKASTELAVNEFEEAVRGPISFQKIFEPKVAFCKLELCKNLSTCRTTGTYPKLLETHAFKGRICVHTHVFDLRQWGTILG